MARSLFYIFHFRDRRDRACRNGGRSLAVPATQGVRDMAQNAAETRSPRRTAPKEERELQLVVAFDLQCCELLCDHPSQRLCRGG